MDIKEKEIWKDIPGYETLYQVSSYGNVKNSHRNKNKKLQLNYNGYYRLSLSKNNKNKRFSVHTLVAISFLNYKPDGTHKLVVNHIDGNRLNNNVTNLEIVTQKENIRKGKQCTNSYSKFVGVWVNKRGKKLKFPATVVRNRKRICLGTFNTEEEANEAIIKFELSEKV